MSSTIAATITVLLLSLLCEFTSAEIYCKDESGKNVDWYIVYKLPKIKSKSAPSLADGFKYAFISGPSIGGKESVKGWKLSEKQVGDANSIFGKTLAQVYSNPDKYTSLQYNDDPPGGEGNTYWAHAKGSLAMDEKTGFWLTHSIPNFPPPFNSSKYSYPDTAANNGQTALCISFKSGDMAKTVLNHLLTLRPNIYYSKQGKSGPKDDSVYNLLVGKKASKESFAQYTIKSVNGMTFNTFSKSSKAGGDLYSQYVAPGLQMPLLVETWRRGAGGPLASECKAKYNVENVDTLELELTDSKLPSTGEWSYTQDHAKWAVTDNEKAPFTCIADINRMESQFKRGGGTVCMQNKEVWKEFRKSIKTNEPCKKSGKNKVRRLPIKEYPFPKKNILKG